MSALQQELVVPDSLSPFLTSGEKLIFIKKIGILGMGGLSAITNRRVIYVSRDRTIEEKCIFEPEEKVLIYQKQGSTGALNLLLGGVLYFLTSKRLLVLNGGNLFILTSIPLNTIAGVSLGVSMSASRQELCLLLSLTTKAQIHQPVGESPPFGIIGENSLSLPFDRLGNDANVTEAELLERLPRALCQSIGLPFLPPVQTKTDEPGIVVSFYPKSNITWPDKCAACLQEHTNLAEDRLKLVRKPRPNQMVPRSFGESTPVYNSIGLSSVILTIPYCPECYNRRFSSRQPNRAVVAGKDFYGVYVDMWFENAEYAGEFIEQNSRQ